MAPIEPHPPPSLNLPKSSNSVKLQALDTTLCLYAKSENFLEPVIPGHEAYNCPVMAFLITHTSSTGSTRRILFDAGGRKDYWNYPPVVVDGFKQAINVRGFTCPKGVEEVLDDAGVEAGDLEAIVWSHWHFDHIGDMTKFPSTVKIVVGPGFKENLLPGYPADPQSRLLESDYANHELEEVTFDQDLKIGNFNAHDYFGDGSFYLLDVPGHAVGHMCGLARTTENSFILLGADACHFAGVLRPSPYLPLPDSLDVSEAGLDPHFSSPCPCSLFHDCHPANTANEKRTTPWYTVSKGPRSLYIDPETADKSIASLKDFDASPDVLICIAHDPAMFEVLPLLNEDKDATVNEWRAKGWKEKTRWRFLNELPRDGKPGRKPLVLGWWRDGREVSVEEAFAKP
jgi:glyoxylase-like metal-dependent hydrolase (beta-lactamase superfamily II)